MEIGTNDIVMLCVDLYHHHHHHPHTAGLSDLWMVYSLQSTPTGLVEVESVAAVSDLSVSTD